MTDRPKSTGRKVFERRWRLAQAEAERRRKTGPGCALLVLVALAASLAPLAVVVVA